MGSIETAILIVLATFVLGACQSPQAEPSRHIPQPARADSYYLLMKPDQTQLRDVTDDGVNMYLEFGEPINESLTFFDAKGARVSVVSHGNLVGIPGLKQGLLIRRGNALSYVSVRSGATRALAPMTVRTKGIGRLRVLLIDDANARLEMKKAISAVGSVNPTIGESLDPVGK